MNTTALLVEILVSGMLACFWISLLVIKISELTYGVRVNYGMFFNYASPEIFVFLLAVSYPTGWLLRWVSDSTISKPIRSSLRKKYFPDATSSCDYEAFRKKYIEKAGDAYRKFLELDQNVIRLFSTSVYNYLMIGVLLSWACGNIIILYAGLILALVTLWALKERYNYYYQRISGLRDDAHNDGGCQ